MSSPAAPLPSAPSQPEKRFPALLLGFVGLSLLAHAATFFLFQVTYPPHVTIPPRPTQVTLLTGEGPEQQALLRWVESEDPALVAASAHPVPARLFEKPYRPSYMTSRTVPRSMPIVPESPARAPGPELRALLRSAGEQPAAVLPPPHSGTRLRFSAPLAARAPATGAPGLHAQTANAVEDAAALVGVRRDGGVSFCVLQKSSGDPKTDAAWLAALRQLPFAPGGEGSAEVTWGFAQVTWGDEVVSPTPPAK